ncbi:MAG: NAD-dependent epimerase/dehydratase family protein [Alphaproteobacteria bacterium]|nr:MAG: NAD-dependent epimerase/dehydratase family protein [Alphaproteobacteria bacterium]
MTARRALVTGATGGLGLALVSALRAADYGVRATGRNAAQAARLAGMGAEFVPADLLKADLTKLCRNVDVVFHAAALSSPWGARQAFQRINLDATRSLLQAARGGGVGSFVFVSSPSIYAAMKDQIGLTEASPLPARALNAYAATKREAEEIVLAANATNFRTVSIRPRALIGPDDTVLLPRILALVSRGWFPLFRDGQALVELTDVRDVAQALIDADRHRERVGGKAVNVSGGKATEVRELVRTLGDALGRTIALRPVPIGVATTAAKFSEALFGALPGKPEPKLTTYGVATLAYSQTFDLSRARTLLGYEPSYDAVATARELAVRWRSA